MNVTITIDDQKLRELQDALRISTLEWTTMTYPSKLETEIDRMKAYAYRIYAAREALGLSTHPGHYVDGYVSPAWDIIACK